MKRLIGELQLEPPSAVEDVVWSRVDVLRSDGGTSSTVLENPLQPTFTVYADELEDLRVRIVDMDQNGNESAPDWQVIHAPDLTGPLPRRVAGVTWRVMQQSTTPESPPAAPPTTLNA